MTDADRTRMRKRTVGFVFQKFNLLPNLTARDNIDDGALHRRHGSQAGTGVRRDPAGARDRRTGWITSRTSSPAASSSAWRSRAPSSTIPRSCWPTSPPAISTRRTPRPCWRSCAI